MGGGVVVACVQAAYLRFEVERARLQSDLDALTTAHVEASVCFSPSSTNSGGGTGMGTGVGVGVDPAPYSPLKGRAWSPPRLPTAVGPNPTVGITPAAAAAAAASRGRGSPSGVPRAHRATPLFGGSGGGISLATVGSGGGSGARHGSPGPREGPRQPRGPALPPALPPSVSAATAGVASLGDKSLTVHQLKVWAWVGPG